MGLKYADYAKGTNGDDISAEIADKEKAREGIPESVLKRFDGKSLEDVLRSYAELQELNSKQGNDLGEMRKTVDQLLALQSQVKEPEKAPELEQAPEITVDDIYVDPGKAVEKVVDYKSKQTAERIKKLEEKLQHAELEKAVNALTAKYKNWQSDIKTDEFQSWVKSSPYRIRQFQAADQYDFDAANDLLDAWYERQSEAAKLKKNIERESQFRDATLESSSPESVEGVKTYSRSELLEKRVAAKSGDRTAQRWLQMNNAEITKAYAEGRITD